MINVNNAQLPSKANLVRFISLFGSLAKLNFDKMPVFRKNLQGLNEVKGVFDSERLLKVITM